jgi:hypothetical protein
MSKRSREGYEEEEEELPGAKHMRICAEDDDDLGECFIFGLVPDAFEIIAALLDPLSQRAFCCASHEARAQLGPHLRACPLPFQKWVPPAPSEYSEFYYEIRDYREKIGVHRMSMGVYYDHAAFCWFHMPYFEAVSHAMDQCPIQWLYDILKHDAIECLKLLFSCTLPSTHVRLCQILRDQVMAGQMAPQVRQYAFDRRWINLNDMIQHDYEYQDIASLRVALETASPDEIAAIISSWNHTDSGRRIATSACMRMLVPAFKRFIKGDHVAVNAIIDAMAKEGPQKDTDH